MFNVCTVKRRQICVPRQVIFVKDDLMVSGLCPLPRGGALFRVAPGSVLVMFRAPPQIDVNFKSVQWLFFLPAS